MADFGINPLSAPQQTPSVLQQAGQYGQLASQKIQIDQQKFNLANDHYNRTAQILGGIASDPALDPANVAKPGGAQAALTFAQNQIQNMVKLGVLDAPSAAQQMTQLPTAEQAQQDPTVFQQHAQTAANTVASNAEQFQRTHGVYNNVNNGAGTVGLMTNINNGQTRLAGGPAGFLPNQVGAGGSATIGYVGTTPYTGTLQQAADVQQGRAKLVNGQLVYSQSPDRIGATNPLQPSGTQPIGAGGNALNPDGSPTSSNFNPKTGMVTALTNPFSKKPLNVSAASAASPVGTQAPAAVQTPIAGLPMGTETAAAATAGANVDQGMALQKSASTIPQQRAALSNLEALNQKFTSGPLAQKFANAKNTFNQVSGAFGGPQIDPEGAAAVTEFHKNAALLQQQQAGALGNTATALNNAGYTVPDVSNPKLGNEKVIQVLKGQADALQAKNQAWQQLRKQNSTADYGQFENQFNTNYDPRIYQLPYMNDADKKELTTQLKNRVQIDPNAMLDFNNKLQTAIDNGYIKANK